MKCLEHGFYLNKLILLISALCFLYPPMLHVVSNCRGKVFVFIDTYCSLEATEYIWNGYALRFCCSYRKYAFIHTRTIIKKNLLLLSDFYSTQTTLQKVLVIHTNDVSHVHFSQITVSTPVSYYVETIVPNYCNVRHK